MLSARLGRRFTNERALHIGWPVLLTVAAAGAILGLVGVIDPLWGADFLAASALLAADLVLPPPGCGVRPWSGSSAGGLARTGSPCSVLRDTDSIRVEITEDR